MVSTAADPVPECEASQPESQGACREEVKEASPLLIPDGIGGEESQGYTRRWSGLALKAGVSSALVLAALLVFSLAGSSARNPSPEGSSVSLWKSTGLRFLETDECADFDHLHLLDIVHNNLDKQGPDDGSEGMVFKAKDAQSGSPVFVHINALSDYTPFSARMNGYDGKYGTINLEAGTSVDLRVRLFKDLDMQKPLHLLELPIAFVDIDGDVGETSMEFVTSGGYEHTLTEDTTQVDKVKLDDGKIKFEATQRGIGADNPKHPYKMTQVQKDKTVVFFYKNVHEFNLTIGTTKGKEPRFMNFITSPLLLCSDTTDIGSQTPLVHSKKDPLPDLKPGDHEVAVKGTGKEHTFKQWFVKPGDEVHTGSWIALTRNPANGRMDVVTSSCLGTVTHMQPLKKGDILLDVAGNNVIALVKKTKKLPPLHYNPNFEFPIRTDIPGYIFGRWVVQVGDNVKHGDVLAKVFTPENQEEDITAPCDGNVKSLQNLTTREVIDELVDDQTVAVLWRGDAPTTSTKSTTSTTTATLSTTTKTTSTSTSTGTTSTSTSTKTTSTTTLNGAWPGMIR